MNFDFIIKEACNIVAKEGPKVIEKAITLLNQKEENNDL